MAYKDYFSFETIRDHNHEIVSIHITMIGTIEADGTATVKTGMKSDGEGKMAFGRITIRGRDKKIRTLLNETGCRIRSHTRDINDESVDVISYTAADWRADEAFGFNAGDRVLIEGHAYKRPNTRMPERLPELSVTATGMFLLSRKKEAGFARRTNINKGLVPQSDTVQPPVTEPLETAEDISSEADDEPMMNLTSSDLQQ